MKTNKTNLKAIVLSLGLVAMMMPANAMAQKATERPGGMFGLNDWYGYQTRPGGLFGLNERSRTSFLYRTEEAGLDLNVEIQAFQDPAPLGSGIAILIGAGLGYVALKKKEDKQ
jgi:hypothetical protein